MAGILELAVYLLLFSLVMLFVFPAAPWVFLAGGCALVVFVAVLIGGSRAIARRL